MFAAMFLLGVYVCVLVIETWATCVSYNPSLSVFL